MITKNNDHFTYTNLNPVKKKAGDCVIRSIAIAFDKDWYEIYDELSNLGRSLGDLPNVKTIYESYIESHGGKKLPAFRQLEGGRKRWTGFDLTQLNGTYLIQTAHHLTVVKNNKVRDTWDSSSKSAYTVWRIT